MAKQRCRNCNIEVNADVVEAGTFYNVYHCPNCHRKFGKQVTPNTPRGSVN